LHSQGPPLMISSMINISSLAFDTPLTYASSVISIIILVFLVIAVVLETYVIHQHRGSYQVS
jgi:hypothetical protein